MGSLETGLPLKRDLHLLRSSSEKSNNNNINVQRPPRSRFARLVLFKKIDYLQWICTVSVFFFFVFLFQMFFLPGSVVEQEKSEKIHNYGDLAFLKELDFGEDIKFEPSKLLAMFQKDAKEFNETVASRNLLGYGYRKPKLAVVFGDLSVDPYHILMVTVATSLREIGYEIEVFSLEDGPVGAVWRDIGLPLNVIATNETMKCTVDWLNYNGILVNSLKAVGVFSCLMQEPFRYVPLIWTIHEQILAARLRQYVSSGQNELVNNWRKIFSRATVVVFPNYIMPMAYSACDPGNYIVIPGSPAEAWEADKFLDLHKDNLHMKLEYGPDDFVVAIVGSQLMYKGLWLEHALILQALYPVFVDFQSAGNLNSHLKIIILTGELAGNYSRAVETIALNLRYPNETVKHVAVDGDTNDVLSTADLVIYGSFLEEQSFPYILQKAMCLGKPVIAPDLSMIRKYIDDRVNGYLFPKEDIRVLTQITLQMISNGKLSLLALNAASIGKITARNLMVSESKAEYISLLENILTFPSEVAVPGTAKEIPTKLKAEWQWHLFEAIANTHSQNKTQRILKFLDKLKDRTDQPRGTWEEVYRNARRTDRSLHERDEGELERTGQPLCIYEPYFGEGTWPFLHHTSLYRGLGLSTRGRRPGADDIDAPSRLPLLNNPYYRDVLGEHGAFFAIANRIDRIHRNAWIGFQSWRATARKVSLSKSAERSLLDAIESRRHGDSLYFWARLDTDPRNPLKQDFWSFCDAMNAGNCRFAFSVGS
ncbi:glycosyl transferase family 1 protein [Forsythia ovata]|uniref:Glycosyl transferase family 1 protein n=1 Tax=Forsythia ovata TaxID=205694 RepID=A0ABD1QRD3_9LAMI